MKLPFFSDRRGDGRRADQRREGSRGGSDRRASSDRRLDQRREFVRLVYPIGSNPEIVSYHPDAAPEIIKSDPVSFASKFKIADLSKKAVRFTCLVKCNKCETPMPFNSKVSFTIKFHDGETVDLQAELVRYFGLVKTKTGNFVTLLSTNLSPERIKKEQSFLLKNFPDFCRESQADQRMIEEVATT